MSQIKSICDLKEHIRTVEDLYLDRNALLELLPNTEEEWVLLLKTVCLREKKPLSIAYLQNIIKRGITHSIIRLDQKAKKIYQSLKTEVFSKGV